MVTPSIARLSVLKGSSRLPAMIPAVWSIQSVCPRKSLNKLLVTQSERYPPYLCLQAHLTEHEINDLSEERAFMQKHVLEGLLMKKNHCLVAASQDDFYRCILLWQNGHFQVRIYTLSNIMDWSTDSSIGMAMFNDLFSPFVGDNDDKNAKLASSVGSSQSRDGQAGHEDVYIPSYLNRSQFLFCNDVLLAENMQKCKNLAIADDEAGYIEELQRFEEYVRVNKLYSQLDKLEEVLMLGGAHPRFAEFITDIRTRME